MKEFYRQREPQLTLVPVALNPLIQQVIDLTRARWSDMSLQRGTVVDVQTDLAADLPPILGVESEIREALINLILNAIDAMPDGGTLTLRTRHVGPDIGSDLGTALIEITDTGLGMEEETRRRCLEPFFTTKGERGTGLGLAMVYGVMRRHSAEIDIESAPGQGTTMRLNFPVPATTAPADKKAYTGLVVPSRLRLLLIDDDPLLLKSLGDTLEADGHVIVTASDGMTGVATFRAAHERNEPFALVVTDLGMPNMDGRKVAAALKEISPLTPVILLTGWGQRLLSEDDIPPHVDRVLSKPPKLREVREALAQYCSPEKS
jgi:CheY-like chemotaxis protein/anti-sigma regulatory factor (Ser/Thr protein kinase)